MPNIAAGLANGLCRFFSASGRTSLLRFAVVAVICGALLWACGQTSWTRGQLFNTVVGTVAGAALGKLGVEAVRRLRDAGHNLTVISRVLLGLGLFFLFLLLNPDPAWVRAAVEALYYGVPAAAFVLLFWPARTSASVATTSSWRGPIFAIACLVAGTATASWIAWFEIGMDENKKRIAEFRAAEEAKGEAR